MYIPPSGEILMAAAALTAIRLTQGRSAEEAAVLSAFFCTLGDGIALIAARRALEPAGGGCENPIEPGREKG